MPALHEKAMLVSLSISQLSRTATDKKATKEVIAQHGAAYDAGKFNKSLFSDAATKAITKAANDARAFHYLNTLPWTDAGARILPSANFDAYTQGMRMHRARFEEAVQLFLDRYEDHIDEARRRLNGLFRADDYPASAAAARSEYKFRFDVLPVPAAEDFRVAISKQEIDRIQAEIAERMQAAEATANNDLWHRLAEHVGAIAERLGDPEKIFRDTLISNLRDLVTLIPRLNVSADPRLEEVRKTAQEKLLAYPAQQLRDFPGARKATAQAAQAILDTMAGYCGDLDADAAPVDFMKGAA